MLHQEKKTRTEPVTRIIREWMTCDMCGEEIPEPDWTVKEGRVLMRDGFRDIDGGGTSTDLRADLCKRCFTERLVPWLESQGCAVRREEVSW